MTARPATVMKRAMKHMVVPANSNSSASVKSGGFCQGFRWRFQYPHAPHVQTEKILSRSINPLKRILEDRLAKADRSTLWTFVYSSPKLSKKAFIRKHHIKRLKRAVKVVLNKQGMDEKGRPMQSAGEKNTEALLLGTLQIQPSAELMHLTFATLVADSQNMIRQAMAAQTSSRKNGTKHAK